MAVASNIRGKLPDPAQGAGRRKVRRTARVNDHPWDVSDRLWKDSSGNLLTNITSHGPEKSNNARTAWLNAWSRAFKSPNRTASRPLHPPTAEGMLDISDPISARTSILTARPSRPETLGDHSI